jgi:hypothetical protein
MVPEIIAPSQRSGSVKASSQIPARARGIGMTAARRSRRRTTGAEAGVVAFVDVATEKCPANHVRDTFHCTDRAC